MPLRKPNKKNCPENFHPYLSKVKGDVAIALEKQEKEFKELMKSVNTKNLDYRYAKGKWSIKEALIHIVDTEQIFGYRALAISRGERKKLPGFNQNSYIKNGKFDHITKKQIISNFIATRKSTRAFFDSLTSEDWKKMGKVANYEVQLSAFPFLVAGHTEHHFRILKSKYLK